MATDREIFKLEQIGALVTTDAVNARQEVRRSHTRSRDYFKTSTENAATNVAETLMFTVKRASQVAAISWLQANTTANVAADYAYISVAKKTAGGTSVLLASWNTNNSAEGTITGNVPANFTLNTSGTAIAADDTLFFTIRKVSATGALIPVGTFTVDLEEI